MSGTQHTNDQPKGPARPRDPGREAEDLTGAHEEPQPKTQDRARKDRIPGAGPNGPRAD